MSKATNTIDENIKVFIRQRPFTKVDQEALSDLLDDEGSNMETHNVELTPDGACTLTALSPLVGQVGIPKKEAYKFSGCFLPGSTQQDVYEKAAQPIVESALLGYSGTIFAYGPTNSGKTYTMRGTSNSGERGVMERCIDQLLATTHDSNHDSSTTTSSNNKIELWVSYLQIYCEMITDLLDVDGDSCGDPTTGYINSGTGNLSIREKEGKVYVDGLKRVPLRNKSDFHDILSYGDKNKIIAETNMNATSSRSHSVLLVTVMIPEPSNDDTNTYIDSNKRPYKAYKESTLFLVDLAGSERASASVGHQLQRREEAKAINLSLSSLGNCMNALAEKRKHIPYRDSKLTRLLQGSLGGGSRTCVLVTLPPGDKDSDKLVSNVLKFASRACSVKVAAKVNRYVDYESLYNIAMKKLDSIDDIKNTNIINNTFNEDLQDQVEKQNDQINILNNEIILLKAQINAGMSESNTLDKTSSNISGGYDPSFASRSSSSSSSSSSKDPIALEKYWREQMQITTNKAVDDMKSTRSKFESKIRILNKQIASISDELLTTTNDLTEERTNHLNTLAQVKSYQSKLINIEKDLNVRIDELLTDRNELCDTLENEKNLNINYELKLSTMQSELFKLQNEQVENHEEMIPKSQFDELETLFSETVERLTSRVIDLEERKPLASANTNVTANNPRGGRGSTMNMNNRMNNGQNFNNNNNNKYGLNLGSEDTSTNSKRIQPGGRVIRNSGSAPQPAARGGSRW